MTTDVTPTRKQERINTTICCECFCAIPTEQAETHAKWHSTRKERHHEDA